MRIKLSRVLPFLLVSSVLSGCATTSSTGDAPLNQGNWPLCSAIGALAGGGLGAIESSTWAAGGAVAGALLGTIICYAQDGDEDGDGVFDRRDRCPGTPAGTAVVLGAMEQTADKFMHGQSYTVKCSPDNEIP